MLFVVCVAGLNSDMPYRLAFKRLLSASRGRTTTLVPLSPPTGRPLVWLTAVPLTCVVLVGPLLTLALTFSLPLASTERPCTWPEGLTPPANCEPSFPT